MPPPPPKGDRRQLLLLVRHGRAEENHSLGDASRALTAEGRTAFRAHARALTQRIELVGVVTSPLVRAVQTAELLADAFKLREIAVRGELEPGARAAERIAGLGRELGPGWALVGHNPGLADAAAALLGVAPGVRMKKGTGIGFKLEKDGWRLEWVWAPGKAPKRSLSRRA